MLLAITLKNCLQLANHRLLDVILRVTKNIEDPVMGMSLCLKWVILCKSNWASCYTWEEADFLRISCSQIQFIALNSAANKNSFTASYWVWLEDPSGPIRSIGDVGIDSDSGGKELKGRGQIRIEEEESRCWMLRLSPICLIQSIVVQCTSPHHRTALCRIAIVSCKLSIPFKPKHQSI